MKSKLLELENALSSKHYRDVDVALVSETDSVLVSLLDCRNKRVGDCAADVLIRREKTDAIIDAITRRELTTLLGKIRALSVLHRFGKACQRAKEAYLALMNDANAGVVDSALFGLAFLQDDSILTLIRDARQLHRSGSPAHEMMDRAISAIEEGNPFIYSPGFHDAGDVWGLDKSRFGGRIG